NADWFQQLHFSYDMSVPNVARLEAQRGGCCTLTPYFLPGDMVELPVTMAEDYTLLYILKDHSMAEWKRQMKLILEGHGIMNFIIHPDYVSVGYAQDIFKSLLDQIATLRSDNNVWVPLAGEVADWWRHRRDMKLVPYGHGWVIEGRGSERASV